jgi:hypothetical protein
MRWCDDPRDGAEKERATDSNVAAKLGGPRRYDDRPLRDPRSKPIAATATIEATSLAIQRMAYDTGPEWQAPSQSATAFSGF